MILKIYLESSSHKKLVGTLERKNNEYIFTYDEDYYYSEKPLQLGPELSLKQRTYKSPKLFNLFKDRIPSRENEAFNEYCFDVGIDPDEKDEMILLAKLGARGPSSFVIEEEVKQYYRANDLKKFRERLQLSMKEFSLAFDISISSIQRIENEKVEGKEILKRIELYDRFPDVAKFELFKNRHLLTSNLMDKILKGL